MWVDSSPGRKSEKKKAAHWFSTFVRKILQCIFSLKILILLGGFKKQKKSYGRLQYNSGEGLTHQETLYNNNLILTPLTPVLSKSEQKRRAEHFLSQQKRVRGLPVQDQQTLFFFVLEAAIFFGSKFFFFCWEWEEKRKKERREIRKSKVPVGLGG